MGDVLRTKVASLVQTLNRRYGEPQRPTVVPPPSSADAAATAAVAAKNAQIVAAVVLGLHGAPGDGFDAARKLMTHFVDWNEVRVSRPTTLANVLGRMPLVKERLALLQRFLEAYFLRQRNLNLDYLFSLKTHETKRFLSELEVFDREELAAVYLVGFNVAVFPPGEKLREVAERVGLLKPKVTALQMAKRFETGLSEESLFPLYSHLYSIVHDPDGAKVSLRKSSGKSKK